MSTPYVHAQSSAKKFGGQPSDYQELHLFLDESKLHYPNWGHRAFTHNSFFIGICERIFGAAIKNSEDRMIATRLICEQHIREDCDGKIPTIQEWFEAISNKKQEKWMNGPII